MDFSELTPSARDRIEAASIDARAVFRRNEVTRKGISSEAYWKGDVSWVQTENTRLVTEEQLAIGQLFDVIALEVVDYKESNEDRIRSKLDSIGAWIQRKFNVSRHVIDDLKDAHRAAYLRGRAESPERGSGKRRATAPTGNTNVAQQRAATQRRAFMRQHLLKRTRSAIATGAGIAASSLYRWLSGEQQIRADTLDKLAKFLGVDAKEIPNEPQNAHK